MSTRRSTGFTIVEVVLFLGITGLIMAFMLNGLGSQLNERRYQDATTSLVGYLQKQYNLVTNVNNSRPQGVSFGDCNTTGVAGTSDCTIVGRILHSGPAASETTAITSAWVVAMQDVTTLNAAALDVTVLSEARLTEVPDGETYEVSWGTKLVQATNYAQPLTFTILIVRVPTTGVIRTYVDTDANKGPHDIVGSANVSTDFKLCVDPAGLLRTSADPAGALIRKAAANSSGVEFVPRGECV